MHIRKTTPEDIPQMLRIYDAARAYMRKEGNTKQWADNYPAKETLLKDIENGYSHVCTSDDGSLCATFCFQTAADPTYLKIYEGNWLNYNPYAVIHRSATDGSEKHIFRKVIDYCFTKTDTIRIDTHRDNATMHRNLKSYGFTYCGIIYLANGAERLAYQLTKKFLNN